MWQTKTRIFNFFTTKYVKILHFDLKIIFLGADCFRQMPKTVLIEIFRFDLQNNHYIEYKYRIFIFVILEYKDNLQKYNLSLIF